MDIPLPLPASSSHRTLRPGAFAQPPLAPASSPGKTVTPFAADPSAVMRSTTARGNEGGGRMATNGAGGRAGGMASDPRSASVREGLVQSRDWAYEGASSGLQTIADSRKGSDASWMTGQTSQSGRNEVGGTGLGTLPSFPLFRRLFCSLSTLVQQRAAADQLRRPRQRPELPLPPYPPLNTTATHPARPRSIRSVFPLFNARPQPRQAPPHPPTRPSLPPSVRKAVRSSTGEPVRTILRCCVLR